MSSRVLLWVTVGSFVALGVWLLLVGPGDSEDAPGASTPAPSAPASQDPAPSPSPVVTTSAPDQPAAPTKRDPKDLAAERIEAAEAAARAFARPRSTVSAEQWRAELEPFISERYIEDFAYIDPREVPYAKVNGSGRRVETDVPGTLLTLVRISTDAGAIAVEVEDTEDGPKAMAIYPWDNRE